MTSAGDVRNAGLMACSRVPNAAIILIANAITAGTRRRRNVTADPGQDPRGAPDLMPLWNILDATPEGRSPSWYPKLNY